MLGASVNTGFKLGDAGFLNLSVEYRDREETNRAGVDSLRVNPPRVTQRIGDADAQDALVWLNGELPVGDGELYCVRRRVRARGRLLRLLPQRRRRPHRAGPLPQRLPAQHHHRVEDASLRRRLSRADFAGELGLGHERQPWPQRASGSRGEQSVNVSWWYEPRDPATRPGPGSRRSPTLGRHRHAGIRPDDVQPRLPRHGRLGRRQTGRCVWPPASSTAKTTIEIEAGDPVSYAYGRTNNRDIRSSTRTAASPRPASRASPASRRAKRSTRPPQLRVLRRCRVADGRAVPGRRRGALRGLLGLRQHHHRQAVRALRLHRQVRAAQHGLHRLPCAQRAAGVLQPALDQPELGRRARRHPDRPPGQRRDARVRRAGPQGRDRRATLDRPRREAEQPLQHDRGRVPDRHRRPHHLLQQHPAGAGGRLRHAVRPPPAARSARSSTRSPSARRSSSPTPSTPRPTASTWSSSTTGRWARRCSRWKGPSTSTTPR